MTPVRDHVKDKCTDPINVLLFKKWIWKPDQLSWGYMENL